MKFSPSAVLAAAFLSAPFLVDAQGQMVKMCLFYDDPSGHARSDPIIDQQCASGHVHTVSFFPSPIPELLSNVTIPH